MSEAAALSAALTALAGRLAPGGTGIADLARLTGGASAQTWRFTVTGGATPLPLILRRRTASGEQPNEAALPLAREASLLRAAAAAGVPVPALIHEAAPEDGLGEALIVAHVEGEALGRRVVSHETLAAARPLLAEQAGAALARIHAIPIGGLGLPTLDAAATLDHYEATYRRSGALRPVLDAAFALLRRDLPPPAPARLVHGDFRTGNLMIHPARGLAAVLDWELAHLGDPAEDLGWLCVNSWRFGAVEQKVGGFGTVEALRAGYVGAGGDPGHFDRRRYWQMLGSLKWAVMCLIMVEVFTSGADRSVERAAIGRRVSECEADLLALMEAA